MQLHYEIEVKYKHSIPDNLKHWQVFEDDEHLKNFLQEIDEFLALHIEEEQIDESKSNEDNHTLKLEQKIAGHNIIQLSNNYIPKRLVLLEKIFDHNDVSKNSLLNS